MLSTYLIDLLSRSRPIATLSNTPVVSKPFDKFYIERLHARRPRQDGIVLTVAKDATAEVDEWVDCVSVPLGDVRVAQTATYVDLRNFQLNVPNTHLRHIGNYVKMLDDESVIFQFKVARWEGQEYPIGVLNRYFENLRRAYTLCDEAGTIHLPLRLGSVNHLYTSKAQMKATLVTMAYHFFRDDTEF